MRNLYTALLASAMLTSTIGLTQTQLKVYTTMGTFTLEMSDSLTPITSGNFIDLADSGYYDGVIFHRVINGFMIQGGDPTGTGSGGPGYTIPDEFDTTNTLSNTQKSIAMANAGPNTGGSQFFINLVNNTYLDWDKPPYTSAHPVFGVVIDSFEVVQAIGAVPVNSQNRPITPVVMDSIRIIYQADTTDTTDNDTTPTSISTTMRQPLRVQLFPNPVGLESVLIVEATANTNYVVSVIDQSGRIITSERITVTKGMNRITNFGMENGRIAPGVYMLRIEGDGYLSGKKFVVTR